MATDPSGTRDLDPLEFSELLDADRMLDAIGQGELAETAWADDSLAVILDHARADIDHNHPTAPDMSLVATELSARATPRAAEPSKNWLQRSRFLRGGTAAVAAGSASFSGLLVAGGMAAVFAFGGISYAVFSDNDQDPGDTAVVSDNLANGNSPSVSSATRLQSQNRSAKGDSANSKDKKPGARDSAHGLELTAEDHNTAEHHATEPSATDDQDTADHGTVGHGTVGHEAEDQTAGNYPSEAAPSEPLREAPPSEPMPRETVIDSAELVPALPEPSERQSENPTPGAQAGETKAQKSADLAGSTDF